MTPDLHRSTVRSPTRGRPTPGTAPSGAVPGGGESPSERRVASSGGGPARRVRIGARRHDPNGAHARQNGGSGSPSVQGHWSHKLKGSQKELQLEQIRVCTELGQSCLGYNPGVETVIHILKQTEREEPGIEPGASSRFVGQKLGRRIATPCNDPKVIARTLRMCKQAIHKIYAGDTKDISAEKLYRAAYNLVVLHKEGGELYSVVETTMTAEVQSLCKPLDVAPAPAESALFLQALLTRWDQHSFASQFIRDIFMYMDRTFVPTNGKTPIKELGLRFWRDEMARSSKTRQSLVEAVKRQKGGEDEPVPGVNKMLTELGADVKDMPCLCFQDSRGLHIVAGP